MVCCRRLLRPRNPLKGEDIIADVTLEEKALLAWGRVSTLVFVCGIISCPLIASARDGMWYHYMSRNRDYDEQQVWGNMDWNDGDATFRQPQPFNFQLWWAAVGLDALSSVVPGVASYYSYYLWIKDYDQYRFFDAEYLNWHYLFRFCIAWCILWRAASIAMCMFVLIDNDQIFRRYMAWTETLPAWERAVGGVVMSFFALLGLMLLMARETWRPPEGSNAPVKVPLPPGYKAQGATPAVSRAEFTIAPKQLPISPERAYAGKSAMLASGWEDVDRNVQNPDPSTLPPVMAPDAATAEALALAASLDLDEVSIDIEPAKKGKPKVVLNSPGFVAAERQRRASMERVQQRRASEAGTPGGQTMDYTAQQQGTPSRINRKAASEAPYGMPYGVLIQSVPSKLRPYPGADGQGASSPA